MGKVTEVINALHRGDGVESEPSFAVIYETLRVIARQKMSREAKGHILQPTALVNEAFLRLAKTTPIQFRDRGHFFRLAARAMHRILIDNARSKNRIKRGSGIAPQPLSDMELPSFPVDSRLLDLDEALNDLELVDPTGVELVKLYFFAGLTMQQCAETLGISKSTAERKWRFVRAWLKNRMDYDGMMTIVNRR